MFIGYLIKIIFQKYNVFTRYLIREQFGVGLKHFASDGEHVGWVKDRVGGFIL